MKKYYLLTLFLISTLMFSQTSTKRYNSQLDRYEHFDSKGNLTGYESYNKYNQQWEYFSANQYYGVGKKKRSDPYEDLNYDQDKMISYLLELKKQQTAQQQRQQNNTNIIQNQGYMKEYQSNANDFVDSANTAHKNKNYEVAAVYFMKAYSESSELYDKTNDKNAIQKFRIDNLLFAARDFFLADNQLYSFATFEYLWDNHRDDLDDERRKTFHISYSLRLWKYGNNKKANEIIDRGLKFFPTDKDLLELKSKIGKESQNSTSITKSTTKDAVSTKTLFTNLENSYSNKNYIDVITIATQLERDIENSYENKNVLNAIYIYKSYAYYYSESYEKASDYFSKIIDNNVYKNLGEIYFLRALSRGKMKEYIVSNLEYEYLAENSVKLNFDSNLLGTVYNNIAYNYIGLKQYDKARPYIEKALIFDQEKEYIWDTKGELEYIVGNYKESVNAMDKAIKIKELGNSYLYRGLSKIKLKKKSEGCNDLSKAIKLDKKEASSFKIKFCK